MSQYSEKLIELLHNDYPDLSGWTIICASDRAVDPVQHFIHTELGGILPRVEGLKSYIIRKSSEELNLEPVPGDEQLLYFIRFVAEKFPNEPYPARRASVFCPLLQSSQNIKSAEIQFTGLSVLPTMNGRGLKSIWKPRRLFGSGWQN